VGEGERRDSSGSDTSGDEAEVLASTFGSGAPSGQGRLILPLADGVGSVALLFDFEICG
jgi:hypothetical protein